MMERHGLGDRASINLMLRGMASIKHIMNVRCIVAIDIERHKDMYVFFQKVLVLSKDLVPLGIKTFI